MSCKDCELAKILLNEIYGVSLSSSLSARIAVKRLYSLVVSHFKASSTSDSTTWAILVPLYECYN